MNFPRHYVYFQKFCGWGGSAWCQNLEGGYATSTLVLYNTKGHRYVGTGMWVLGTDAGAGVIAYRPNTIA